MFRCSRSSGRLALRDGCMSRPAAGSALPPPPPFADCVPRPFCLARHRQCAVGRGCGGGSLRRSQPVAVGAAALRGPGAACGGEGHSSLGEAAGRAVAGERWLGAARRLARQPRAALNAQCPRLSPSLTFPSPAPCNAVTDAGAGDQRGSSGPQGARTPQGAISTPVSEPAAPCCASLCCGGMQGLRTVCQGLPTLQHPHPSLPLPGVRGPLPAAGRLFPVARRVRRGARAGRPAPQALQGVGG